MAFACPIDLVEIFPMANTILRGFFYLLIREHLDASAAHLFIQMILQILAAAAKNAAKLAFFQNDRIPVRKDLKIVILVDIQIFPKLLRKYKSAEVINPSENSCTAHLHHHPMYDRENMDYSISSGISQL